MFSIPNENLDAPRILAVPGGIAASTSAAERAKASLKDFISTTRYQNCPIWNDSTRSEEARSPDEW